MDEASISIGWISRQGASDGDQLSLVARLAGEALVADSADDVDAAMRRSAAPATTFRHARARSTHDISIGRCSATMRTRQASSILLSSNWSRTSGDWRIGARTRGPFVHDVAGRSVPQLAQRRSAGRRRRHRAAEPRARSPARRSAVAAAPVFAIVIRISACNAFRLVRPSMRAAMVKGGLGLAPNLA